MKWKSLSHVWLCATPWTVVHRILQASFSLIQGIFPTQGSNSGLPHYREILYQLSHKRSPRILACVAYPFSSGSSQPRNQTGVSCTAGRFFTNWALGKAPKSLQYRYSQAVSHSSTNQARPCLASEIRWDRVPSGGYGHSHHFMAKRWGNSRNSDRLYFGGGSPKSLMMMTAAVKLRDACSLEEKLWPT